MRYAALAVRDLMSAEPIRIGSQASLDEALSLMRESDVRHLPVLDGDGRLVGILSHRDILRELSRHRRSLVVAEAMTADMLTVHPETPAREASALLLDHKIGALPVVDDGGALVGLLTETDLLRVAHQALGGALLADEDRDD